MRYILIEAKHQKVFDWSVPVQIDEQTICDALRCDRAHRIELVEDVDLWVAEDPRSYGFALPGDQPPIGGHGVVAGRSRLGDFKSLPLRITVEMIAGMVRWPVPAALPRRVNAGRRKDEADRVTPAGHLSILPQMSTASGRTRESQSMPAPGRIQAHHFGSAQAAFGCSPPVTGL